MPALLKNKIFLIAVGAVILLILVSTVFLLTQRKSPKPGSDNVNTQVPTQTETASVSWQWSGAEWKASGTPPDCASPLIPELPVDINKVSGILYPGQTRGGNYKAHGGFGFDQSNNTDITVTAPLNADVVSASRYIEQGEVQYLFTLINPCGIAYRFDHLLTLSEKFQKIADELPAAMVDDSRTTPINPAVEVTKGETVATAVGFAKTKNVSLDFGVYDLRSPNKASQNPTFASKHESQKEFVFYGICWLKELPSDISQKLLSLPASGEQGKTSDYCN